MKLRWKLFFSHLAVLGLGLAVLSLSVAYAAPANFDQHLQHMGHGMMRGREVLPTLVSELNANFRASVNGALLRAGAVAAVLAIGLSWLMAWRITRPVSAVVAASQRIADGQYNERLAVTGQDELGVLLESFNRMAAALAETETMRQALLADVTHELKTPLTSIMGMMEGLQDGVIPPTPATFQLVHQEAQRLQRLVQDLQELSRVEARQIALHPQTCDPLPVVAAVVERLRPHFNEKNIQLQIRFPTPTPYIYADADRLTQVLLNLLGNALHYAANQVMVSLEPQAGQVRFAVQDDGIGLAAADVERIFQRFYRVDKSRARSSGGSGIGLTIARSLIEQQGGRLWAESQGLGRGSTFYFTLPLSFTKSS